MTEDAYEKAKTEVADTMARTGEIYGFNRSYGRLYGILYFSGEIQSLDELAEDSGYAKSTVSNAMQTLERYHLVHRRSLPGEGRKVYYEPETDFWTIIREFLEQQGRREIRIMQRGLENAEVALKDAPETEQTKRSKERVHHLQRLYEQSERAIDYLTGVPIDQLISDISDIKKRDNRRSDR